MIKVLVNGAFGRMGSEVVRMVTANPELELIGGVDVAKNDPRLEAYGSLDELNAHLALLREYLSSEHRKEHIFDLQILRPQNDYKSDYRVSCEVRRL